MTHTITSHHMVRLGQVPLYCYKGKWRNASIRVSAAFRAVRKGLQQATPQYCKGKSVVVQGKKRIVWYPLGTHKPGFRLFTPCQAIKRVTAPFRRTINILQDVHETEIKKLEAEIKKLKAKAKKPNKTKGGRVPAT